MDGFDWDDANRDHIAKHGISVEEAEDVCLRETLFLDSYLVDGEWRVESIGSTRQGRILVLVTTDRDEQIRVVTAFDAPRKLRRDYIQWMVKNL